MTPQTLEPLDICFRATPVRIVGRTCTNEEPIDRGDGVAGPCRRPVWGDGMVRDGLGNQRHDLCSRCWHMDQAFHGPYVTFKANPAASSISNEGLARLFVTRGLDAEPLPPVGAHVPGAFPDWLDPS